MFILELVEYPGLRGGYRCGSHAAAISTRGLSPERGAASASLASASLLLNVAWTAWIVALAPCHVGRLTGVGFKLRSWSFKAECTLAEYPKRGAADRIQQ